MTHSLGTQLKAAINAPIVQTPAVTAKSVATAAPTVSEADQKAALARINAMLGQNVATMTEGELEDMKNTLVNTLKPTRICMYSKLRFINDDEKFVMREDPSGAFKIGQEGAVAVRSALNNRPYASLSETIELVRTYRNATITARKEREAVEARKRKLIGIVNNVLKSITQIVEVDGMVASPEQIDAMLINALKNGRVRKVYEIPSAEEALALYFDDRKAKVADEEARIMADLEAEAAAQAQIKDMVTDSLRTYVDEIIAQGPKPVDPNSLDNAVEIVGIPVVEPEPVVSSGAPVVVSNIVLRSIELVAPMEPSALDMAAAAQTVTTTVDVQPVAVVSDADVAAV